MTVTNKIEGTEEAWEDGLLGTDDEHVIVADNTKEIEDALGLQPISIRLQRSLLEDLKAISKLNGIGYQPLIRQVLTRFVTSELKSMLRDRLIAAEAEAKTEESTRSAMQRKAAA